MEEWIPPLRNLIEKKKRLSLWALFTISLFFLGILVLLFLRSPFSTINKIEVSGNELILTDTILEKLPFSIGVSYFSIDQLQVKKTLTNLPEVKSVDIHKVFPNKIYITIHEKKIVAFIRSNGDLYPVFEDGLFIKKTYFNIEMHRKPILEGWLFPNKTLKVIAQKFSKLPNELINKIDRVKPVKEKPEEIEIITKRKHHIYLRVSEVQKKLKVYPSFYKHPPGDLYLLEGIWFKPKKYS